MIAGTTIDPGLSNCTLKMVTMEVVLIKICLVFFFPYSTSYRAVYPSYILYGKTRQTLKEILILNIEYGKIYLLKYENMMCSVLSKQLCLI